VLGLPEGSDGETCQASLYRRGRYKGKRGDCSGGLVAFLPTLGPFYHGQMGQARTARRFACLCHGLHLHKEGDRVQYPSNGAG